MEGKSVSQNFDVMCAIEGEEQRLQDEMRKVTEGHSLRSSVVPESMVVDTTPTTAELYDTAKKAGHKLTINCELIEPILPTRTVPSHANTRAPPFQQASACAEETYYGVHEREPIDYATLADAQASTESQTTVMTHDVGATQREVGYKVTLGPKPPEPSDDGQKNL